jgi:hypothetical protein
VAGEFKVIAFRIAFILPGQLTVAVSSGQTRRWLPHPLSLGRR